MKQKQSGNILIMVLLGVALFAALSFVLSRQMGQSGSSVSRLSTDKASMLAGQLTNHATQMRNVIGQMVLMGGNTLGDLNFTLPTAAGFNDAPTSRKVFHRAGGGMPVFTNQDAALFDPASTRKQGWVVATNRSVGWAGTRNAAGTLISPTSDVLYSFVDVHPDICAALNRRLAGDDTIPTLVGVTADALFLPSNTDNLSATTCPDCDARPALCVKDATPVYVFYTVAGQR